MDEQTKKKLIQQGRDFLHYDISGEDFVSDQQMKLPQPPLVKAPMRDQSIDLPMNFDELNINNDFMDVINKRQSHRIYTDENISLLQLSYLLWATQGIKSIRGKSYATLRTVPSGGARHGFETYLLIRKVDGLKPGKYHYLPMGHKLEYLGEVENIQEVINDSLCKQPWTKKASVVFYWSIVCYRNEWRYGINAHRPLTIDAGHVGQNLYLACTALGLGTCAIAAYDNTICDPMFELDGNEEFVMYTSPVGTISLSNQQKEDNIYAFVKEQGL
ncbi:SagB/ThcOx family dehydrogenase [Floccifex sp.]|uniref:SagB/ThcOx family dehydrogenase n=1 Tax=Floccifex sp. TaxID=2815810 RepID=UPI003EFDEBC3